MDTEPVNPFQSPQAVDPLPREIPWRPRWRDVLLGLAIVPLSTPLTFIVIDYLAELAFSSTAVNWQRMNNGLEIWLSIAYVSMLVAGLPGCRMAWNRWGLTAPSVASAGWFAFATLLSLAILLPLFVTEEPLTDIWNRLVTLRNGVDLLRGVTVILALLAPFPLFALYLAYLRRRDQNRGGEPRG